MVIMMISGDDYTGSKCHHNVYFSREAISCVCERRGVDVEAIVVFLEQNKVLPKKRISLVLIFPFPRIFAWMSHLKTIDAYPLSDPPPLADHGNILAWRPDPQSNHWRHRCHQLIINTTKKIDFTIIVKNILKKLFPNLTINHHHQPF